MDENKIEEPQKENETLNEKTIKFNSTTILLILSIIIIIILCVYIVVLKNDTNSNEETNNNEVTPPIEDNNSTIENNDNELDTSAPTPKPDPQPQKKDTLTQLSGEFYDIKTLATEYRDNTNVKNYKEFIHDLDFDGTTDKVTLRHVVNEQERDYYFLEYNGASIYEWISTTASVGIVDLDSTDKYLDIWVYDDGYSADPMYYFYRKVGSEIIKLGEFAVDRGFYCDGKGKVLAANLNMPWVNPQVFDSYYTIENNTFEKHSLDFSYNKDYEYTSKDAFFTTDLENLRNYEKNIGENAETNYRVSEAIKYNINKLDSNTKFKIIEFVENTNMQDSILDLKVTLSDGTTGYLIHPFGRFYIFG